MAGEWIGRYARRLRGSGAELAIGGFSGFNLWVADTALLGPEIVLKRYAPHLAEVSTSAHSSRGATGQQPTVGYIDRGLTTS